MLKHGSGFQAYPSHSDRVVQIVFSAVKNAENEGTLDVSLYSTLQVICITQ